MKVEKINLNEQQNSASNIADVRDSACSRHKPKELGYLQWHDWAEIKIKRGAKPKQCSKCGRWYFKEEF